VSSFRAVVVSLLSWWWWKFRFRVNRVVVRRRFLMSKLSWVESY